MIENHLKKSKLIALNFYLLYLFIEKIVKINCFKLSPIFLNSIPLKKRRIKNRGKPMRDTVQNREIRETTIREKKKTRSMKDRKKSDTKHPLCRCLGKGLKSWLPPTKHFFSLSPFFPPFLYLSIIPSFVMEQWRILIRNTSLFLRIGVAKKFHSSE